MKSVFLHRVNFSLSLHSPLAHSHLADKNSFQTAAKQQQKKEGDEKIKKHRLNARERSKSKSVRGKNMKHNLLFLC